MKCIQASSRSNIQLHNQAIFWRRPEWKFAIKWHLWDFLMIVLWKVCCKEVFQHKSNLFNITIDFSKRSQNWTISTWSLFILGLWTNSIHITTSKWKQTNLKSLVHELKNHLSLILKRRNLWTSTQACNTSQMVNWTRSKTISMKHWRNRQLLTSNFTTIYPSPWPRAKRKSINRFSSSLERTMIWISPNKREMVFNRKKSC